MSGRLAGKVALITGTGGGQGRAAALAFTAEGAKVVGCDLDVGGNEETLRLVEAAGEVFPDARWQRCVVHWYRNAFAHVPRAKMAEVALMLKAIHASESRPAAEATAERVRARLEKLQSRIAKGQLKAAEKVGFHVHPQLKEDIAKRRRSISD